MISCEFSCEAKLLCPHGAIGDTIKDANPKLLFWTLRPDPTLTLMPQLLEASRDQAIRGISICSRDSNSRMQDANKLGIHETP